MKSPLLERLRDGLRQNLAERVHAGFPLLGSRCRRAAEVSAVAAGLFEARLSVTNRFRQADSIRRERATKLILHQLGTLEHDDRAFVSAGVTCAALELVAQAKRPGFTRDVREDDAQESLALDAQSCRAQRGDVSRLEVRIGDREPADAMLGQSACNVDEHG